MKIIPVLSLVSEPCPPTNVQASVKRDGKSGTVTWEPSTGAVAYVAHVTGRDGQSLSCYSTTTFCDVEDLHCGVTYHARVIAIGLEFNSTESNTILLVSGTMSDDVYVCSDIGFGLQYHPVSLSSLSPTYLLCRVSYENTHLCSSENLEKTLKPDYVTF